MQNLHLRLGLTNSLVLATGIAFFCAERLAPPVELRSVFIWLSGPVVCLLYYYKPLGIPSAAVWLLGWLILHSPSQWAGVSKAAKVVHASGCGFTSQSVLVEDSGRLWQAKSKASEGDIILAKNTSHFTARSLNVVVPVLETSRFCQTAANIRSNLMASLEHWPSGRRDWLQSFVLGADSQLDSVTVQALRRLGLLHIVVLSGGHLAVIAGFFLFSTRLIPSVLFSLRLVTMRTWPWIWTATTLASLPAVVGFSAAVGMSQSVQRALLMFVLFQVSAIVWGHRSKWTRFKIVWIVQCVLFPVNIYSLTTLLTWSGSLILHANLTSRFRKSVAYGLFEDFKVQLVFMFLSLLVFGESGLLGLASNLVLMPVFSLCLVGDLWIAVTGNRSALAHNFVELQMSLLSWIRQVAAFQLEHPGLVIRCPKFFRLENIPGQLLFLALIGWLVARFRSRESY